MLGKTLFLDQGETLGGAERFLIDFLNQLSPREIKDTYPLVLGGNNKKYREYLSSSITIRHFDYPSVRGNVFKKIKVLFQLLTTAKKLCVIAKHMKTNVIFSNTPRTHFVMFFAKKIFRIKTKWIVMIHDFSIPPFLLKKICNACDNIVVNSTPTRQYVRKHISEGNYKKIRIVENSIDYDHIAKPKPPTELKKIMLLGRIDPQKGQIYALKAAEMLQKKHHNFVFQIVGDPFPNDPRTMKYKEEIRNFAKEKGLKNIEFIPEVPDPLKSMRKADCILALPTAPETFGRIVIEALAMGKLVLAFNEIGPKEIMQSYGVFLGESANKLLVEKKDARNLAEHIEFFATHPKDLEFFTTNARTFVEKNFSAKESKKRLLHVILD